MAASFIGGGNPGKTIDLPEVTDKMYPIKLYRMHVAISGIRTHNYAHKTWHSILNKIMKGGYFVIRKNEMENK